MYYVRTRAEMARWVTEGACVALDPDSIQETFRILVDAPTTTSADQPGRPCVVEVEPQKEPTRALRGKVARPRRPPPATPEVEQKAQELLRQIDGK